MVEINTLIKQGKIDLLDELNIERYLNFLNNSYKDNLNHSLKVIEDFPRWSIISDATTILILKEFIKSKEVINLIEKGYKEFLNLANELDEAKKERVKVQYYTGTKFLKEEYKKRAKEFNEKIVIVYLKKIEVMLL